MKKLLDQGIQSIDFLAGKVQMELTDRFRVVKEKLNDLPVFVSSENTQTYGAKKYDEKHYFVVPFMLSESKIVLHTMRCLPDGVPEINDLPKRRIFHFPNEHSEALVRHLLIENTKDLVQRQHGDHNNTLINLANDIDALDRKLTYGMLLVGAAAAWINPLVGAGIAAKAFLPGATGLISKYGLRPAGEKLNEAQLKRRIKEAEQGIQKEFESATTLRVINPILQELELALRTDEGTHDPLTDFDLGSSQIEEMDDERWRELTATALCHIYTDAVNDPRKHRAANLGPEDIRWLKVILNKKET